MPTTPTPRTSCSCFYGPNAKSVSDGENTANYQNPEYDKLFEQLKMLDDGPQKQAVIDKMVAILREDAPWSFGFYPWASTAVQGWVHNSKPAILIRDHGRYLRLDVTAREAGAGRMEQAAVVAAVAIVAGVLVAAFVLSTRRSLRSRVSA